MSLARSLFYAWEKRLAFKDDPERRVLDFQWGAEFLPPFGSWHPPEITPSESEARALLHDHAERALESSEDYFASCPKIQTNSKTRAPGHTRLRGALKNLGHELGRNTIKRILAEHGIAPAPERGRSMSWSTFIKAHWGAIAATDLFTVEVVNPFGLVRYHVLFVIDIATRCVCIGGITSDPNGEWMKQVARNLTDMWDGFLLGKRYLIHDRDPLFTEAVRGLLRDSGVKPLRLPANSPNLNAYAERFVLSIRRECLDHFVPLSERHLRTAVTEYVVHYHTERNHQGLGNELLTPLPASANDAGPIVSRERLGGILNYYCRAA